MPRATRQRPTAPDNPLVIQPSQWNRLEHAISWTNPGLRRLAWWHDRFYSLAKQLGMSVTEYVTEAEQVNVGLLEEASLTYTAARPGLRITMRVTVQRQWRALSTFVFGTVAWGAGPIPVDPEQTEGPFLLPLRPLLNSERFQASGAPRWVDEVPPNLGPRLDAEWRSWMTTLYRSAEFTLIQQMFSVWSGRRAPLIARFLTGHADLGEVQQSVEAIDLPQRVRLRQVRFWWVDPNFQRKFALGIGGGVLLFMIGALVYGISR